MSGSISGDRLFKSREGKIAVQSFRAGMHQTELFSFVSKNGNFVDL